MTNTYSQLNRAASFGSTSLSLALLTLLAIFITNTFALDYPADAPSKANYSISENQAVLENSVIRTEWSIQAGQVKSLHVENKHTRQKLRIQSGYLPVVVLDNGQTIDLASLQAVNPLRLQNSSLIADYHDQQSGLAITFSATLNEGDNAITQSLKLTSSRDTKIKEMVFLDTKMDGAKQVGEVSGSVVVCGDIFMAIEHPLALNKVGENSHIKLSLPRGNVLKSGQSWTYTSTIGVVPAGQLRRGFLYYLERRRAHPYRQFLHYNNWYDVFLARPVQQIKESECLDAIHYFGTELTKKRGVKIEGFVWDHGWDNFATLGKDSQELWGFHAGFPKGFKNLISAASKYGATQGVWISPWGGYASSKDTRVAYGKSQGLETNSSGFSMAGPKYQKVFRDVCLDMIRNNGVSFFKFDGMGQGNLSDGSGSIDDIDAVLEISKALRKEKQDVFISATVGTWASPFWLLYADSIWRQGDDNNLYGKGNTRQQWLTYRDKLCYERIVKLGPLYPLNALMLHGVLIGDRKTRTPSRMVLDDKSVGDEAWSFFGSGTGLQELYIAPHLMTDKMTDHVANAANWARANSDVLIDTHWIGGNPGKEQVYGWASWKLGKGIIILRNPSDKQQEFNITPKQALQLPDSVTGNMSINPVYPKARTLSSDQVGINDPLEISLKPFETVVMELK